MVEQARERQSIWESRSVLWTKTKHGKSAVHFHVNRCEFRYRRGAFGLAQRVSGGAQQPKKTAATTATTKTWKEGPQTIEWRPPLSPPVVSTRWRRPLPTTCQRRNAIQSTVLLIHFFNNKRKASDWLMKKNTWI